MFESVETYCMFIGYPRSGHSLVGALLNAHPEMIISHELDALRLIKKGVDQDTLFERIVAWDRTFGEQGRVDFGFDYRIPGAWQGQVETLKVIGDKKGGRSAWWLVDEPPLLDELRARIHHPIRFLHVIRSPWDNVATISLRGRPLDEALKWYLDNCEAVRAIKGRIPDAELLDLRHEALLSHPRETLVSLCDFLGVTPEPQWLRACEAKIRPSVHRSRFKVSWTPELRATLRGRIPSFPWFDSSDLLFDEVTS